jgi:hypothetical protein
MNMECTCGGTWATGSSLRPGEEALKSKHPVPARKPALDSADLQGPRHLLRIRPEIVDLGPKSAPKPDETKPKMPRAVPTNRHKPIPFDFGPFSVYFGRDPKPVNCEIAQSEVLPEPIFRSGAWLHVFLEVEEATSLP